jgi:hypothetical protein
MAAVASKPIKLYDHRGRAMWRGAGDRMIGPARQTTDRKRIPLLDFDFHRNVSAYGRRTLLTLGRHIYFASSAVRGAVEDLCRDTAGTFMFESRSASAEFKTASEHLLYQHDRISDIAGPPYNHRTYRKLLIRAAMLDGDIATVYVKGEDGLPYHQTIPAHRIRSDELEVKQPGPYDGARIIDGVIVNDSNRALAYRVQVDDSPAGYIDIPASSMSLHFIPIMPGQVRGLSILGLAAWEMQDIQETKSWEMLAQKTAAGRVFQEENETGEAPIGSDFVTGPTAGESAAMTPTGLWREEIGPGINTYFKGMTGSSLKAVEFNRPARMQLEFAANSLREAFAGAGLSWDFHLNLSQLNGGPLRLLTEKINRRHEDLRADLLEPACRRFDFFRLGTFIDTRVLPSAPDWTDYEYQPDAEFTPDRGYESDVIANEIRVGIQSRSRGAARRGESLADIRNLKQRELDDLLKRAEAIHALHPTVSFDVILDRLEADTTTRSPIPADEEARPVRETSPSRESEPARR